MVASLAIRKFYQVVAIFLHQFKVLGQIEIRLESGEFTLVFQRDRNYYRIAVKRGRVLNNNSINWIKSYNILEILPIISCLI